MAKPPKWTREKVRPWIVSLKGEDVLHPEDAMWLLRGSHARTLRILARLDRQMTLNQYELYRGQKTGYFQALADVREAQMKGRG